MIPDGYTDLAPGKIASVVTYLEMLERPTLPHTSSRTVSLRRVERPGIEWYRALYRRVGSQWFWFSRAEMTNEQLAELFDRPTSELFIAEHAAREIGMAELDRSERPNVEITSFGLFPDFMGKGLGRPFMAELLTRAWSGMTDRVWLHTCTLDAPAALTFYIKCGFRPYKRAIEVADDPRIRGVLPPDVAPQVPLIR
jgi:GNAT superfamily N-acetyltransferase